MRKLVLLVGAGVRGWDPVPFLLALSLNIYSSVRNFSSGAHGSRVDGSLWSFNWIQFTISGADLEFRSELKSSVHSVT